MSDKEVYRLADSTAVEPLINSWLAWSDTISPAPYSMHLVHYQLKTLNSYLSSPEAHVKASRNPKFIGGPFVDIPPVRAGEVRQLLDDTMKSQRENIEFAGALTNFYDQLSKEAKGQSLEPYYEKKPAALNGYVELNYDYYNNPIVRFFESLLYESPYYNKQAQSLRIFQQPHDDSRPFFLNTPRLPDAQQIDWQVAFESPSIDELFRLCAEPQPLGAIREMLDLNESDDARLLPLLTTESAPKTEKWNGATVRVRYFGHACVLVEWNGVTILTDPWIGVTSQRREVERLSYHDLPEKIDFAIITHGHHDHFVLETLLHLRSRIGCLVVPRTSGMFYADPSLKIVAEKIGFKNVVAVEPLESIEFPGGEIIAVPFLGEHADLPHGKTGYVVRCGREQILFAADSNCLDKAMYVNLRKLVGPIETVFLGMECVGAPISWMYGSLLPIKQQYSHDQSRRTKGCDSTAASNLLEAVGARRVYIYALGSEPWLQYCMGLGPSENSPQLKEARKVLSWARDKNFIEALRPYGQYEFQIAGAVTAQIHS
ncbi:MAG TPA: MBL fold metallo-hydrolase [Pyrinomonadaceae bacterium]